MAPSSSSKSKKSSKPDSDEDDRPSSPTRSSSSKNADKTPKTSLLKSMFTRDNSEVKSRLRSEMFRDESRKASSIEVFKDGSKKASSRSKSPKPKPKSEKARPAKVVEEETWAEEPDFSDFKSSYSEPVKEKKVEKKKEEKRPAEKKKEEKKVEKKKEEKKVEKKKEEKKKKSVRKESQRPKLPIQESSYENRPIKSAFAAQTAFKSSYDIDMAEKQTKIAELKGEELIEQERWAHEKLKGHAGTCPMGFNWARFKQKPLPAQVELEGYRCLGGAHFATHELLAQGKGEIYIFTDDYTTHINHIMMKGLPVQTPYFGKRWHGPFNCSDLPKKTDKPDVSLEDYALQIMPMVFGTNIHPAMIPELQRQLVEQIKAEEDEYSRVQEEFAKQPSSKGGPWWEDCH